MATAKQTLEYEVRLRDLATKALRRLGKTAKKEAARASKAFKGMGKAIKLAGVALVAAFSVAAFQGMRKGIERAREFSKAMGEVNTILGEGSLTIGEASDEVNKLALALGVPAPEVAAGLYQTLSAGVTDSAEAMILLEGATKLGIAGLSTTKEAVSLLTTVFNAYGEAVTEKGVKSMNDMIFKTVNLGVTTIPALSASMGKVLPVAAQLGITFAEVAAATNALTLKGLSQSEATTQLNAVFTAFLTKSDLAKKTFGETTNLMGAQAIKTKGLQVAMSDLMEATGGSEDALFTLTGQAEAAKAIMSLTADDANVLKDQLIGIADSAGAADDAFKKMSETMDRKLLVVMEGVTQGFAELGDHFLKTLTGGATSFKEMSQQAKLFKELISDLSPLVDMIGFSIGVVVTGVLTLSTGLLGLVFTAQKLANMLGLVSDEDFADMGEKFAGMASAMLTSADATENFGRSLIGMESNGMKASKAFRGLVQEFKEGRSGVTGFKEAVAQETDEILVLFKEVEQGRMTEQALLDRIKTSSENFGKVQKEHGIEITKQQKSWQSIIDKGVIFGDTLDNAKSKLVGLGDELPRAARDAEASIDRLRKARGLPESVPLRVELEFDEPVMPDLVAVKERVKEVAEIWDKDWTKNAVEGVHVYKAALEEVRFERSIQIRMMEDGFEKEKALAAAAGDAKREVFKLTQLEATAAYRKQLDENATLTDAERRSRFNHFQLELKEKAELENKAISAEVQRARAAAIEKRNTNIEQKHAEIEEAKKLEENALADSLRRAKLSGAALAQEFGGALSSISELVSLEYFEISPTLKMENLEKQLASAEVQIEVGLALPEGAEGKITPEMAEKFLAMISNVREFELGILKADAAVKLLGTSLVESLDPSLASLTQYASFDISPTLRLEQFNDDLAKLKVLFDQPISLTFSAEQKESLGALILDLETVGLKTLEADARWATFQKTLEGLGPVTAGLKTGFFKFAEKIPEIGEAMAEVTEGSLNAFASGMGNAFGSFIDGTKTASEAFKQFAAEFIKQVAAMIIQALILAAIKALIGGFGEGGVAEGGVGELGTIAGQDSPIPRAEGGYIPGGLGSRTAIDWNPAMAFAKGGVVKEGVGPRVAVDFQERAKPAMAFAKGGVVKEGVGPRVAVDFQERAKPAMAFAKGGVVPDGLSTAIPMGLGRALPVRGYAMGGSIVKEPHMAVIGEGKMNEAIVPLPDGRSIPVEMRGGGETSISFTINAVDARGVDELLVERQDTIRSIIRQAMTEDRLFRNTMRGG